MWGGWSCNKQQKRLQDGVLCMKPSCWNGPGGLIHLSDSTSGYKTSKGVWWRGKFWNNYRIIQRALDVAWCRPGLAWTGWMHTQTSAHYISLLWARVGFLPDRQWNWNQVVDSKLAKKHDSTFVCMHAWVCMCVHVCEREREKERC